MEFDHVGMITDEKKADENWVEDTRVWVTDPNEHPYHVEYLRYEPDTPVTGPLRNQPHVAFKVENLEESSRGLKCLLGPFEVGGFVRVAFFETDDGAVVELMQYLGDKGQWFDKKH